MDDVGKEMKFKEQEVRRLEYMTYDGYNALVKPIAVEVIRYDKYDQFSEPVCSASIHRVTNLEKLVTTV